MPPAQHQDDPPQTYASRAGRGFIRSCRTVTHHVKRHLGVGIICSVAYFDPGNWSVDLQAGSSFGYRPMLFVIFMAGIGAIIFQILASKLGCVTGLDLATHCRLLLHDHPRHPKLVRRCFLYPLYVLSEIAIISTDLAELLGSAIGICLLFPKLPLWAGVVLTAADVLIFLMFSDPSRGQGRPVRVFEYTVIGLVLAVFSCFVALLVKASPNWSAVFMGYVPDKNLFQSRPDAVYAAVGILGATVMPHALFLGSSLATQDRVSDALPSSESDDNKLPTPAASRATIKTRLQRFIFPLFRVTRAERMASTEKDYRTKHGDRENNSIAFIRQHLSHGIADVVTSLLVLAVPINSAILILAAAVFFNKPGKSNGQPAGLFEAYEQIKETLGPTAAVIFALALVCAGQTSSITVTLAGQIVSEGFIEWKVSPFLRRLITRCISLVPSVFVAAAVGRNGISNLLVVSQVVLSVVLPFVAFPLIYLTSRKNVMRVHGPPKETPETDSAVEKALAIQPERDQGQELELDTETMVDADPMDDAEPMESCDLDILEFEEESTIPTEKAEQAQAHAGDEMIDFSNGRVLSALAYTTWCVILVANAYAIVMVFML